MDERPHVVVTESLSSAPLQWLAERAEVASIAPDESAFDDALHRAEGLVVRTYTRVDETMIRRAPHLRVVGRAGVGLDNVDVDACRARGVEVVYSPESNTQAVVEFVFALLADALRPRPALPGAPAMDAWRRLRAEAAADRQLSECRLGILGLGRVGRRVAEVAAAFGTSAVYHDLREIPAGERFGAAPVGIEELFATCDVITVHVDGRASNRGLVGATLVERMADDVVFLNTSRGFVVDNVAVAAFLASHPRAQALLDVHDPEPPPAGYPLFDLPNAVLLPHIAGRTRTAMANMSWVVRDVWAVLRGERPRFPAP